MVTGGKFNVALARWRTDWQFPPRPTPGAFFYFPQFVSGHVCKACPKFRELKLASIKSNPIGAA